MSSLEAQMTHARRSPFLAAHMARCDAEAERRRMEQECEQEAEDGE